MTLRIPELRVTARRLGVVSVSFLVACATTPSAETRGMPSTAEVLQTPTAAVTPSPTPTSQAETPSPSPTREPTTGTLTQIGTIEVGPLAAFGWHVGSGLIGFDAGYVAWAMRGSDAESEVVTWFSPDGATWTITVHSVLVAPCPDWSLRPNLDGLYSAASDGWSLILVASVLDSPTRTTCDEKQLVALQTTNGTTWARSEPFGVGWAESTWTMPDGFETRSNGGTIWRSVDGLAWAPVFTDAHGAHSGFRVAGASSDGRRLAVGQSEEGGTTLFVSRDADPWSELTTLPPGGVGGIQAPVDHGRPWVVVVNPYLDQDVAATVYTSTWKPKIARHPSS